MKKAGKNMWKNGVFKAMNDEYEKTNSAFTLAEVLVTLAIIGVVAALTIPTVINNYQKQQTVVKLKKIFNTLNQAVQMSTIENGSPSTWDMSAGTDLAFWNKYLKNYLKVNKIVSIGATTNVLENIKYPYKWFNGNNITISNGYISTVNIIKIVLSDGSFLAIQPYGSYTEIFVDVNGYEKGPNIFGKDVFSFRLTSVNGKLLPTGNNYTQSGLTSSCKKTFTGSTAGFFCAALIMRDGWEINYDW